MTNAYDLIFIDPPTPPCPGCGIPLTDNNVGGYSSYCLKCVTAMPPLPLAPGAYNIAGKYPDFFWIRG